MKFVEFRELVENARDIVIETDLAGNVLYASPRIEAVLGWPLEAFLGENMYVYVHPEDQERVTSVFASVAKGGEGGTGAETYRHRHRDGSWRWLESSGRIFRSDDDTLRAVLVTRDVTEVRRVELEQERFFSLSTELLAMIDVKGCFTRANDAWEGVLGWTAEELVGASAEAFLHPDDLERTRAEFERALVARKPGPGFENRYRHRDGSYRSLSWQATAVPELGLTFAVGRDVTAQRRVEEQHRHSQKMEALGRMAGGVAHDFNNYLTVMTGYTEMLLDDGHSEASRRAMVREMSGAAERAAQLTRQLLVFSRKELLETSPLDVAEIIAGMDAMVRSLAGDNIDVTLEIAPDVWWVEANRGHVEQIFLNLLTNARDSMPRGGPVRVELVNHGSKQVVGSRPAGEWVSLIVEDGGKGMDEETIDRIFEPFFTTKEAEHGTGLGLSLVHGIVNQVGGHIHVESERGIGTKFVISLPRVSGAFQAERRPRLARSPRSRGERILLVEDDLQIRKLAARVLESAGYEVVAAHKGEEALRLSDASDEPFDLLVTDVLMKRMDGVELAQMMRRRFPALPVLFVSGYADDRIPSDLLEANCRFVPKPFAPADLRRHAREILDAASEAASESAPEAASLRAVAAPP